MDIGEVERLYGRQAFNLARSLLRNDADAQDAYVLALFKLWRSDTSGVVIRHSGHYLMQAVYRASQDVVKGRVNRREVPLDALRIPDEDDVSPLEAQAGTAPDPLDELIAEETRRIVRDAVDRLPEHHRAVIVGLYFEGLSQLALALRLGVAEGTIKSRSTRALESLRRKLPQEDLTCESG